MDKFDYIEKNSSCLWSIEYENEVTNTFSNWQTGAKISRAHYHLHGKFALTNLSGMTKVIVKRTSRMMASKEMVINMIKDFHSATGHKREKKTYVKIVKVTRIYLESWFLNT